MPARRRHHEPGHHARQQRRASSASTAGSYATSSRPTTRPARGAGPHRRRGRQGRAARSWRGCKKEDSCFLLHLSEGVTDPARRSLPAAISSRSRWRRTSGRSTTVCRHPLGGPAARRLRRAGASTAASMVWSPLSNLLLYGGTARVEAAQGGRRRDRARQRLVAHGQQEPAR